MALAVCRSLAPPTPRQQRIERRPPPAAVRGRGGVAKRVRRGLRVSAVAAGAWAFVGASVGAALLGAPGGSAAAKISALVALVAAPAKLVCALKAPAYVAALAVAAAWRACGLGGLPATLDLALAGATALALAPKAWLAYKVRPGLAAALAVAALACHLVAGNVGADRSPRNVCATLALAAAAFFALAAAA